MQPLGRVVHFAALAAAAFLGGTDLIVEQDGHALDLAQFKLHGFHFFTRANGDALGPGRAAGVLVGVIGNDNDPGDALAGQLLGHGPGGEAAVVALAAGQGNRVVEQQLVGHVHARGDGRPDRQQARVVVGAIAHVLEQVRGVDKGTHADPRRALSAHVGVGDGALGVDVERQRVTADARTRLGALGHLGRGVVRAACAVPRDARGRGFVVAVDARCRQQSPDPVRVGIEDTARGQPPVDGLGHVQRAEFAVAGQQRLAFGVGLPDQLRRPAVGHRVDDQARGLILDQRALFFDDQQFIATQRKVGEGLRLQRPDLRDLEHADTEGFEVGLGDAEHAQGIEGLQMALADADDAQPDRAGAVTVGLQVDAVGAGKGLKRRELEVPQPFFLRQHGVGVADVEALGRQVEISRRDEGQITEVEADRAGALDCIGHALETGPRSGVAAGGVSEQAQRQEVMDRGGVEHRDPHADQHGL